MMNEYCINGLTIKENLLRLAGEGNKKFTESLHPGIENVLGVRVPTLRQLAAQIAKDDWQAYLQSADTFYMEERMLQGMVIGCLKIKDVEEYLSLVSGFVPLINSWSVCDTFDFAGKQRFVDRNKERVWQFLEGWMQSDKEYEIRFGVVMAMAHYIDADYIQNVLQWMNRIDHEGYYVKMAVAWALSVCYVKFPKETMLLLKENRLDDFTYNKPAHLPLPLSHPPVIHSLHEAPLKKCPSNWLFYWLSSTLSSLNETLHPNSTHSQNILQISPEP